MTTIYTGLEKPVRDCRNLVSLSQDLGINRSDFFPEPPP